MPTTPEPDALAELLRALRLSGERAFVALVRGRPEQREALAERLRSFAGEVHVADDVSALAALPAGSLVLVGVDEDGAKWLNRHRDAITARSLRVVMWMPRRFDLRAVAPDLNSWTRMYVDLPVPPASTEAPKPPPTQVPTPRVGTMCNVPFHRLTPTFTGRKAVLDQLEHALASQHRAGLTQPRGIHGLGGVGKTQTALRYADLHRAAYDALLWVGSDGKQEARREFAALADVLGLSVSPTAGDDERIAAVTKWLGEHERWLLVFDNADEPTDIAELMPRGTRGHVLLTSRARVLQEVGVVDVVGLGLFTAEEARAFLRGRVGALCRNDAAANDLAEELGYLPLALEQAAAFVVARECTVKQYLSWYRRRHGALLAKSQTVMGDAGRTVATTWSMSIDKVRAKSPAAAELLAYCALLAPEAIPWELFERGGTKLGGALGAVLAYGDDGLALVEVVAALRAFSLVERDGDAGTLTVHRLVQEVVAASLAKDERTRRRLALFAALDAMLPDFEFPGWPAWERLLRHVLHLLATTDEGDDALDAAAARVIGEVGNYCRERGRYDDAERLIRRSLRVEERVLDPSQSALADTLNNLAVLAAARRNFAEAEALYRRALGIYEAQPRPDEADIALTLNNLAGLLQKRGKLDDAEPLYQRALELFKRVLGPDHPYVAGTMQNLAIQLKTRGKFDEAEHLYRDALAIKERALAPDDPDIALTLHNLASLLLERDGAMDEALAMAQRSVDIEERAYPDGRPGLAKSLHLLANILAARNTDPTEVAALRARATAMSAKFPGWSV